MATKLGKVGMTLGGSWDATRQYDKLTCVLHNGVSWSSRVVVPAGVEPSEANYVYWQKVSERGEQGPEGPRGLIGLTGPRGLQGNSGYTGAADELEVVNNLETNNAIAALSAAQGYILNTKVAQLDQEWQSIKDAEFNVMVQPHVEKVIMTAASANLEPDKFYIWTNPVSAIAITLNPQTDAQYVAQYLFQFTCPAESATSLSLPVDVVWNEVPTIKAGKTYQVSILERLAIITAWN